MKPLKKIPIRQRGSLLVEYAVIGAVIVGLWAFALTALMPAFAEYTERYGWAISLPL